MEGEGRLAGYYVVEHDTGKVHLWTRVGGKTDCGRKVENKWHVMRQLNPKPGHYCQSCFGW